MGTTSSPPPGSSIRPAPSRPKGPPKLPASPSSTPASASLGLPAGGEARGPNNVGVLFEAQLAPQFTRPALCSSLVPPASPPPPPPSASAPLPHPKLSPCPSPARTRGAALPPRPPGRTPPGSRARPLSVWPLPAGPGMRLDRGGGPDTGRSGQPYHTSSQAVGQVAPARLGLGFF